MELSYAQAKKLSTNQTGYNIHMYIVIRKYKSADPEQVMQKINEGFVAIISRTPGFIDYYVFQDSTDNVIVVNMFDGEASGQASNEIAKKWVDENISHLYAGPPEIFQGEAGVAQ